MRKRTEPSTSSSRMGAREVRLRLCSFQNDHSSWRCVRNCHAMICYDMLEMCAPIPKLSVPTSHQNRNTHANKTDWGFPLAEPIAHAMLPRIRSLRLRPGTADTLLRNLPKEVEIRNIQKRCSIRNRFWGKNISHGRTQTLQAIYQNDPCTGWPTESLTQQPIQVAGMPRHGSMVAEESQDQRSSIYMCTRLLPIKRTEKKCCCGRGIRSCIFVILTMHNIHRQIIETTCSGQWLMPPGGNPDSWTPSNGIQHMNKYLVGNQYFL